MILATNIFNSVNITLLLSVITVCITLMATLIRIFGPLSKVSDEILRKSQYLMSLENVSDDKLRDSKYLNGLEDRIKDKEQTLGKLRDVVQNQHTELEKLKIETNNTNRTVVEIKEDNKKLVDRLDNLLTQIMEYMDN